MKGEIEVSASGNEVIKDEYIEKKTEGKEKKRKKCSCRFTPLPPLTVPPKSGGKTSIIY